MLYLNMYTDLLKAAMNNRDRPLRLSSQVSIVFSAELMIVHFKTSRFYDAKLQCEEQVSNVK